MLRIYIFLMLINTSYSRQAYQEHWDNTNKCGSYYPIIDVGGPKCDPDSENPCCNNENGKCGNTTEYCSCESCVDFKYEKEWWDSESKDRWRNDGKCGRENTLPDFRPAECDPEGDNPCCDHEWSGQCGNTAEHCSCDGCVDYKRIQDEWRETGGKQKWRYDGKCGSEYPLPDGLDAKCNPDGENPCCNHWGNGQCGNTTDHCSCEECTDFKFEKEWQESGGSQRWRNDEKCGKIFLLPDYKPAECDPDGENPCCDNRKGQCGNKTEDCSCEDCVDYSRIYKDWRESGGAQKWRYDGKCGANHLLPDRASAECDPDGVNPCCDSEGDGRCGNTMNHCSCYYCTDYKFRKDWRDSGGKLKWRYDGKCGTLHLLPDFTVSECNPDGENPCCDSTISGLCGNTKEYCTCEDCINYYDLYRDWRESSGNQKWRRDGKCGGAYLFPDGTTHAQCNPDGENPCCDNLWYGRCGNTTKKCSCTGCIDYRRIYKDWRVSGGVQKWRYDGKCGSGYPLPDGTPAQCDPDGENPCCDRRFDTCGGTLNVCLCENCVDYRLINRVKESGENCAVVRLASGFLKYGCFDDEIKRFSFKCFNSDVHYVANFTESGMKFSEICTSDPHAYQVCGFDARITNGEKLCGGYSCDDNDGRYMTECQGKGCTFNSDCNASDDSSKTLCDGKCDNGVCEDESYCNGYRYGVRCDPTWGRQTFYPASSICSTETSCMDGSDQLDCNNTEHAAYRTCIHYKSYALDGNTRIVPILNYTKCSVLDYSISLPPFPYCLNFLDQTNCSDIARIGGYCFVNGTVTSVSKFVVCLKSDPKTKMPINLCDDNIQNDCVSNLAADCTIHKHRMCDGRKDCYDGSDEDHDMCGTMNTKNFNFTCTRSFNLEYGSGNFPSVWIMDGTVDCMNGEDEELQKLEELELTICRGTSRNIISKNKTCEKVFKCPGLDEHYISFEDLCDGVDSCGNGAEISVCQISRDFPPVKTLLIERDDIRDACQEHSADCKIEDFPVVWGASDVFGVRKATKLLVPTTKIDCTSLFGEHYLFLSCMNLCAGADVKCPLSGQDPLVHNSCPQQFPNRTYTIADKSFLTFLDKSDSGIYHQEYFQCNNKRCVQYKQVCDLIDDCGDMSDEINCKNHAICEDTLKSERHQFISLSQRCDGIYDCFDLSDECNDECGRGILKNWVLKLVCWLMGTLAMLFNFFTVVRGITSAIKCQTENMLTSKVLMSLIGFGDFLIGLYLVILSTYDSIIMGKDFCKNQAEWLTGPTCLILGIISTLGSQISLFTMTVLSVIRMYGLIFKAMRVPGPVNVKAILRVISLGLATIVAALTIALIPLTPSLEDYFVQGMFYDPTYKVFIGFPNKERHINILQAYHGKNKTGNVTLISSSMSWRDIGERVDAMFSQDHGSLTRTPVHFYGNDGLCLFKYFVRNDDARRNRQTNIIASNLASYKRDPVVWTILAVNLFCFIIITCCYVVINIQTKKSSQRSGQQDNPERLRGERAIQNKIMIIIATDFLCWVPFIAISAMHSLDYIDATSWYATFAMTVLPLNSVINPLVYDKELGDLMARKFGEMKTVVRRLKILPTLRRVFNMRVEPQVPAIIPGEIDRNNVITSQNPTTESTTVSSSL